MSHSQFRWHGFGDAEQLALAAASKIQKRAVEAIDQRGAFHLVLAGGTTPRRIYSLLAAAGCDWPCWQVYFGDERCLPPGDAGRNDTMAREHWLNAVNMQADQIHTIPAERGARSGARDYAERLQGVACFDLVLLGLGEDGHTASLFSRAASGRRGRCSGCIGGIRCPQAAATEGQHECCAPVAYAGTAITCKRGWQAGGHCRTAGRRRNAGHGTAATGWH